MAVAGGLKQRLHQRLPPVVRELLFTLFAILSLLSVVSLMVLCQVWSDMRWVKWNKYAHSRWDSPNGGAGSHHNGAVDSKWQTTPLDDVVLDMFTFTWNVRISDALVNSAAAIGLVGCMLMIRGWQGRLVLLRRTAWMVGALYFVRAITLSLTTMPPTLSVCKPREVHGLRDLFLEVVPKMITGELSACTDKIFSGHTSILVFIFLMWVRYSRHWAFIVYSGIHTVVGISSVLLTRLHYSVDVLLAIVMVFFVHHTYYWSLEIAVRERAAAAASSAPALVASAPGGYRPVPPGEGAGSTLYPCADVIQIPDILVGEDAEKAIGVPRDCITHAASTIYRVDAAELLINRKPSMVLPTMVAWMDGLWMR